MRVRRRQPWVAPGADGRHGCRRRACARHAGRRRTVCEGSASDAFVLQYRFECSTKITRIPAGPCSMNWVSPNWAASSPRAKSIGTAGQARPGRRQTDGQLLRHFVTCLAARPDIRIFEALGHQTESSCGRRSPSSAEGPRDAAASAETRPPLRLGAARGSLLLSPSSSLAISAETRSAARETRASRVGSSSRHQGVRPRRWLAHRRA